MGMKLCLLPFQTKLIQGVREQSAEENIWT